MITAKSYHEISKEKLYKATFDGGQPTPTANSARALIEALHVPGAKNVSFICPYMKPLAKLVANCIDDHGIEVQDFMALKVADNLEVASLDPDAPVQLWNKLDIRGVDTIVASTFVQMPSLSSIDKF